MVDHNNKAPFGYQFLLVSLVLLVFVPGLFQGELAALFSRILFTLILLASLYLTTPTRRKLLVGLTLAIPVLTSNWLISYFVEQPTQSLVYSVFQIIFILYIISQVFRHLVDAKKVDSDMIYAALCLYLLIGLCWTLIYFGILLTDPEAIKLHVETDLTNQQSITALLHELIYFSYVTQTTLGYGDLTPVSGIARSFVIAQSLIGQIYVAVVIARLVGLQIASTTKD